MKFFNLLFLTAECARFLELTSDNFNWSIDEHQFVLAVFYVSNSPKCDKAFTEMAVAKKQTSSRALR